MSEVYLLQGNNKNYYLSNRIFKYFDELTLPKLDDFLFVNISFLYPYTEEDQHRFFDVAIKVEFKLNKSYMPYNYTSNFSTNSIKYKILKFDNRQAAYDHFLIQDIIE